MESGTLWRVTGLSDADNENEVATYFQSMLQAEWKSLPVYGTAG